ncbi:MAG: type II secretion system F family protein [Elusimicrobia bacterium]|nr:type II secretion system F family protein [Elusimicrobiota bacterium]
MPEFRYEALDASGKKTSGVSTATGLKELTSILRSQGLFLVDAREAAGADTRPGPQAVADLAGAKGRPVDLQLVALFTTQLSIMVRTALPLMESIQSLGRQQSDPTFKAVVLEVARSVQHGQPLSAACARFPNAFDEVYVSLLSAGEATGQMAQMLDRLAQHLQFRIDLRSKVRSALLYPSVVVLVAFCVVAFLVLFIIPTFAEVFSQFDLDLPLPTRMLLGANAHLRSVWYLYLFGIGGAWWYFWMWLSSPSNTRTVHDLQLRLPVAGTLVRNIVMTRVLRTLASLVAAGVPILKSLNLSQHASGNMIFHEILAKVQKAASEGRGLASALAESPYFPEMVTNMVANAEKTGTLPEALERLSFYFERETDSAIKDLFAVLEPILVVGLGVIVAGIAVAVLLPIFELGNSIQ